MSLASPRGELWTTQELRLLKRHYSRLTCRALIEQHLPERSEGAIYAKAHLLGLASYHCRPWADREIAVLRQHWGRLTASEIHRQFLPNRTIFAIRLYASMHGISIRRYTYPKADWTAKEDRLLRKHYLSLTARQMQERYLTRRTVDAVRQRIQTLGLPRPTRWSPADIALIRRNGPRPGGIAYLCKHFGCDRRTVIAKLKQMNLAPPRAAWTDAEIETIRRLYPKLGRSLRIDGRTHAAMLSRAAKLRLRIEQNQRVSAR